MLDQEFTDPATVRHNEDWASPDGQEELRAEGLTWYQNQWCQGCDSHREVKRRAGEGLEVEVEEEVDPVTVKESQDAMALFYERMELIENSEPKKIVAENVEVKSTDAWSEVGSSEPGTRRRRRRGGRGSRMRRLLVHQLLLTEKRGLPLSRLLCLRRTEAKSQVQGRREQEESASPMLRRRRPGVVGGDRKAGTKEVREGLEDTREDGEETREKVRGCSKGTLSGDFILSTPRSTQPEVTTSPTQVYPQTPGAPPFPNLTSSHTPAYTPAYTSPFTPHYALPYTLPYTLPFTPHFTPQYTSQPTYQTTPYTPPPCGPMPGLQWLFCGGCQMWGTVTPTT